MIVLKLQIFFSLKDKNLDEIKLNAIKTAKMHDFYNQRYLEKFFFRIMKINILYQFTDNPWGGGNQFLKAIKKIC